MDLPFKITQDQIGDALRWAFTVATTTAVNKGWLTADQVPYILQFAVPIAALIWGLYVKRQHGVIASAEAIPAVTKIEVNKQSTADSLGPKVVGPADTK